MTPGLTADRVIDLLDLTPLPGEGGWFRRTYSSEETIFAEALPGRFKTDRLLASAIYYLITADSYSALHRLPADELFHFYLGDPCLQLQLLPGGKSRLITLGSDLAAGQQPQAIAPRGAWQGTMLAPGGGFALLGATTSPAYEDADLELALNDQALIAQWPDRADLIARLKPR